MDKYFLQVYGCQMNQCEAGVVRATLDRAGFEETGQEDDADVLLMLTCSVRSHAEQRALGRLAAFRARRSRRPGPVVGVLGCVAKNLGATLVRDHRADLVLGPDQYLRLPELIGEVRSSHQAQVAVEATGECYETVRPRVDHPVCASVTVMRGCNNSCTYCIVPLVRGEERSRRLETVLGEARDLAGQGKKDLTLLGQNVLAYKDRNHDFVSLLERVAEIPGIERIRFLTSHPRDLNRRIITAVAGTPKVCPALHLPLQSGSDRILKLMNRGYTRAQYLASAALARSLVPGLSLTTDIMVGFPSETEDDFLATLETVREVRFDFAYMYRFSARPGTAAIGIGPKVAEADSARRLSRLIELQNCVTREENRRMVGRSCELLVEAPSSRGRGWLARTRSNKIVIVRGPAAVGQTITCRVTGIQGWTPFAEMPALVPAAVLH